MHTKSSSRRPGVVGACALALFVNAGSIKSNTLLAWMPIDLTIPLGALVALSVVANVFRRGVPKAMWVVVGVALVALLGALNAHTPYGNQKWQAFLTVTLLALVGSVTVLGEERQRKAFLATIAALGLAITALVIISPQSNGSWTNVVTLEGSNTISTSRMILAGAIVLVMDAIATRRRVITRLLLWGLTAGMVLTALNTGSRGPVVSIVVGIALAVLLAPALHRRRAQSVIAIACVVAAAIYFAAQSDGLTRVSEFLAGGQDNSTLTRASFWKTSWELIPNLPFGGGWGYFGTLDQYIGLVGEGGKLYPHSVPLEITVEVGWFAGIAFVALVIGSSIRLLRRANDGVTLALFVLLVFTVISALSSGDINDNRLMWTMLTLAWIIPKRTSASKAVSAPIPDDAFSRIARTHTTSNSTDAAN